MSYLEKVSKKRVRRMTDKGMVQRQNQLFQTNFQDRWFIRFYRWGVLPLLWMGPRDREKEGAHHHNSFHWPDLFNKSGIAMWIRTPVGNFEVWFRVHTWLKYEFLSHITYLDIFGRWYQFCQAFSNNLKFKKAAVKYTLSVTMDFKFFESLSWNWIIPP